MKYLKYAPITLFMLFSSMAFAATGPMNVNLGSVTAPPGGTGTAQLSLQAIKGFATSLWNINCSIPNPTSNKIVMQFGIVMTSYAGWPQAQLNDKYMGIIGNPQGSLNPGENNYVLTGVDNKAFSVLNFINFDDSQNITIQCFATPSNS